MRVWQSTSLRSQQNIYTFKFYILRIIEIHEFKCPQKCPIVVKPRNFMPMKLNYFTVVAQVNGWTLYLEAIYIGGAHGFGDAAVILSYM